jgi:sodium pump decarboxylase, gamma subunit
LVEKMADAAGNTLMGMGTVFLVLIFISLLISCFKFVPQIMDKLSKKSSVGEKPEVVEEISETVTANEEDDSELIAVIAAAIAASEQTSTDSFVVRSIRRR